MSTLTAAPRPRQRPAPPAAENIRRLGGYTDVHGQQREIVSCAGAADSTLVIDRLAVTAGDPRLVGHLAADEPATNAQTLCDMYCADSQENRRCRALNAEDLLAVPGTVPSPHASLAEDDSHDEQLVAVDGSRYQLQHPQSARGTVELRWRRLANPGDSAPEEVVTVRDVVAALESYEPARALTVRAIILHRSTREISLATLAAELDRLDSSRVVLNRGLREAVQAATRRGLSLSEIAIRCGHIKRDRAGRISGEASWLARRVGLTPEAGQTSPSRWISSDVLAQIARHGLGIAPLSVELS